MNAQPNLGMTVTTSENPMGIHGFEFVEFAAPAGQGAMRAYLETSASPRWRSTRRATSPCSARASINFLLNESADTFAADFAQKHGPCLQLS